MTNMSEIDYISHLIVWLTQIESSQKNLEAIGGVLFAALFPVP